MDIKKIDRKFEKGLALIVGKMEGDIVSTDGIIIDTATNLSDNARILECANISSNDNIIYICGHGRLYEQTIGGKRMSEIARLLVNNGYKGVQDIYITSCDSATKYDGSSMVDKLRDSLIAELAKVGQYNENIKLVVESQSDGSSVVTVGDNNEISLWVLKSTNYISRALLSFKAIKQKEFLNEINAGKLEIHLDRCEQDIEKYRNSLSDKIKDYKRSLVVSEVIRLGETVTINYISLGIIIVVALVGVMGLSMAECPFNKLVGLFSLLVVLISEIFKGNIIAKGDYDKTTILTLLILLKGIGFSYIVYRLLS